MVNGKKLIAMDGHVKVKSLMDHLVIWQLYGALIHIHKV